MNNMQKGMRLRLSVMTLGLMLSTSVFAAEWAEGNTYTAGAQVTYAGKTYTALSTHTAYAGAGWNPASTPTLWKEVTATTTVVPTTAPTATPTTAPTKAPTATPVVTLAPTATTAPSVAPTAVPPASSCLAAWNSATAYNGGQRIAYNGRNYEAKWWTQGNVPSATDQWGPWKDLGACGDVVVTPTPTVKPTTSATPTSTPVVTASPTPTATATAKPTTSPTVTPTATPVVTVSPTPTPSTTPLPGNNDACRPEGMAVSAVADVPYCLVYDTAGREKLANGLQRRNIGYFTNWRTGKDGKQRYLASDIPWTNLTHINYAFAHIDSSNKISVNAEVAGNESTDMTWPGVAGAEMDPSLSFKGHFNLLAKYKKQYPNMRVLVSIGGWAETGGYFGADGKRVSSGGFYSMTTNPDGTINSAGINTFADSVVAFLRQYQFDGADIDYEYPTSLKDAGNPLDWTASTPRLKGLQASYRELMRVLREKLNAASVADQKYYQLTAAVPASGYLLRGMENFQAAKYLDFLNVMSYDLHGTWSPYVGPNAALYDDGKDGELVFYNVYNDPQYKGIGYLNTDWAYHFYRGMMPAGRINMGVPYYTRGWRDVKGGGAGGLWGDATTQTCPPGLVAPCGVGAYGVDNIWFDVDENGKEQADGSNPMWHAKNLEKGIAGDYLAQFNMTAANIVGKYTRYYDKTLVASWLWNDTTKVFISTEDEEAMQTKADWIIKNGIGGAMNWELAGDYDWDANQANLNGTKGQYVPGSSLTRLLADKFRSAAPYGNTVASTANPTSAVVPTEVLDVTVELTKFPMGDDAFPITPTLHIVNNTGVAIPSGGKIRFQYPVSAPDNMEGSGLTAVASGHTGNNIGGLKGDFHTVEMNMPALAIGAAKDVKLTYRLPISGPSNVQITLKGKTFAIKQELPKLPVGKF
ncbi:MULTISPECIES: glycosyl hydrolase family 18 protein [Deefgea]|nr:MULTISPECIES: glycosyl hydrolase family 18 protein [Deefgea]